VTLNNDTLDLADRFFTAIQAGDTATLAEIYSPDATIWHNYDQQDQTREQSLVVLQWVIKNVGGLRYDEIRRDPLPDGFVQQHVLRGTAPDGSALEVPAMMRVYCRDGRITRLEEYLDAGQVKALMRA
jgi:ketosteroid isomerase-like protein